MTHSILRVITDTPLEKVNIKYMTDKDKYFSFYAWSNSNVPTNIIAIWEHWPPILIKKQCKGVETLNCT